jgi:hypothetical protein
MSAGSFAVRDLHVSATDRECIAHVRRKLRPEVRRSREAREARHEIYRDALAAHRKHRALVSELRL